MRNLAASLIFVNIVLLSLLSTNGRGQEEEQLPSQKLKQAVEKFEKGPATVGKKLGKLVQSGEEKIRETFQSKPPEKQENESLTLPEKTERPAPPRYSPAGKRDPFRSLTLQTKANERPAEELSPLERYQLGQLKLVAIVWEIKEPRAMVEVTEADKIVRGYTLTVGTRIGPSQGKVTAIKPDEVVIEESYVDYYGARKKRECRMKLSTGGCS